MHALIYEHLNAYIYIYVCSDMCTFIDACVQTCLVTRRCMYMLIGVGPSSNPVYECGHTRTCTHMYVSPCPLPRVSTCIHTGHRRLCAYYGATYSIPVRSHVDRSRASNVRNTLYKRMVWSASFHGSVYPKATSPMSYAF